ncbi:hypothetical protein BraRD5C2_33500 [Bradyrhizobium sp. RD5-C2]|nr:hypothetical protein BraRD5C2_33500 [Bradyrhizobium sp. RD5-C2]
MTSKASGGDLQQSQLGGFNSLASQPAASLYIGSKDIESISVRTQVEHSNVRSSSSRSPGEMRAKAIRCLRAGHIGRSLVKAIIYKSLTSIMIQGQSLRFRDVGQSNSPRQVRRKRDEPKLLTCQEC